MQDCGTDGPAAHPGTGVKGPQGEVEEEGGKAEDETEDVETVEEYTEDTDEEGKEERDAADEADGTNDPQVRSKISVEVSITERKPLA